MTKKNHGGWLIKCKEFLKINHSFINLQQKAREIANFWVLEIWNNTNYSINLEMSQTIVFKTFNVCKIWKCREAIEKRGTLDLFLLCCDFLLFPIFDLVIACNTFIYNIFQYLSTFNILIKYHRKILTYHFCLNVTQLK